MKRILTKPRPTGSAMVGVLYLSAILAARVHAAPADLNVLLEGVHEIAAPGLPGSITVFGSSAFPVVAGKSGAAREAAVAAATLDELPRA